jgi:hypothetical protein
MSDFEKLVGNSTVVDTGAVVLGAEAAGGLAAVVMAAEELEKAATVRTTLEDLVLAAPHRGSQGQSAGPP